MKKIAVLSLAAAFSLGALRAQDAKPAPDADAPKPLPPLEEGAKPDHRGGPRPWMKDHPGMSQDRGGMMRERMKGMHGPGGPGFAGGPKEKGKSDHGEMLARELGLTPDQQKKAREIMQAAKPKLDAIREEGRAKAKAVIEEALGQLRPLLTPEQQAVLDDLQKLRADKAALGKAAKADAPAAAKKGRKAKDE